MNITASCDQNSCVFQLAGIYDHGSSPYVIAIYMLHSWLPTSRVKGEASNKVAGCGYIMSCLTSAKEVVS